MSISVPMPPNEAERAATLRRYEILVVTGGPRIRFYAGVPLISRDGHCLGTLHVMDSVPRCESSSEDATARKRWGGWL